MALFKISPDIEESLDKSVKWTKKIGGDPRRALIECDEPFTVYRTLVDILGRPKTHSAAKSMKKLVTADKKVQQLIAKLPNNWSEYLVKGHDKVDYPPSVLLLLFDFGITAKDFPIIKNLLEQMKSLQDGEGRFLSLARFPKKQPEVGSSPCDTHIISEALLVGGYGNTPEVRNAIDFISSQLKGTNQGIAWRCEPNSVSRARGPGRKEDLCPQVTLEALRVFSLLPDDKRPVELITAGKTLLSCWERRKSERPYMFGTGTRFKKLRPPFFWYNIGEVLDATSRYPELVKDNSFQEMLSIVQEKADDEGKFSPESVFRAFKDWSFGQKNDWSPWTTLYICRILKRVFG